jgi:hypothetical protein
MKSAILIEGINEAHIPDGGKLVRVNTEKGVLGLDNECLFWSNGGHSTEIF